MLQFKFLHFSMIVESVAILPEQSRDIPVHCTDPSEAVESNQLLHKNLHEPWFSAFKLRPDARLGLWTWES